MSIDFAGGIVKRTVGRAGLSLVLCLVVLMTACSTDWVGQAEAIVSVMIPATSNTVALVVALQGRDVSAGDLQMIQSAGAQVGTDLQLIEALIAAYEKADETARPGILEKIQSGIASVQMNLQGLLQGLHIKDAATQTKVTAVIGILLAEVQSLEALIPLVKNQGLGIRGQGPASSSIHLSANEFVSSYNSTLGAKTGSAAVDRVTGRLKIHLHSSAARVVSGGLAK